MLFLCHNQTSTSSGLHVAGGVRERGREPTTVRNLIGLITELKGRSSQRKGLEGVLRAL